MGNVGIDVEVGEGIHIMSDILGTQTYSQLLFKTIPQRSKASLMQSLSLP